MHEFRAELNIIGINPFVFVPIGILKVLFKQSGKDNGPIPIRGTIQGRPYQQTLVRYAGAWRMYINSRMLEDSPNRIGERISIFLEYDPSDRTIAPHPKFVAALNENGDARRIFDSLSSSLQREIVRYISRLKTDAAIDRNVRRAIGFLLGKERFIGRDRPK